VAHLYVSAARVAEVAPSNDGKKNYVTFLDKAGQGKVKLVVVGAFPYQIDDLCVIDGEVKGQVGQYGQNLSADLSVIKLYVEPTVAVKK